MCFLGDFNVHNISWNDGASTIASPSSDQLENFMAKHLFSQYVLQPTRDTNILDLFLTNSAALELLTLM